MHILALCSGYPWVVYARFLDSLFASCGKDSGGVRVTLFLFARHAEGAPQIVKRLAAYERVKVCVVDDGINGMHCQNHRLHYYLNHINTEEEEAYFITDARDVLFQRNPFPQKMAQNDLHIFQEDQTMGCCAINMAWLRQTVSPERAQALAPYPVLCSGTIAGGACAVRAVLRSMLDVIEKAPAENMQCILDQAALNVVVREGLLPDAIHVVEHSNDDGCVLTLAQRLFADNDADNLRHHCVEPATGKFVTSGGKTAAVVHQFDRLPRTLHTKCCWAALRENSTLPFSDMDHGLAT